MRRSILCILGVIVLGSFCTAQTSNYIPKWSPYPTLVNSVLYENSGNVGLGTTTPSAKLDVQGNIFLGSGSGSTQQQQITSDGAGWSMRLTSPAGIYLMNSSSQFKAQFGGNTKESGSGLVYSYSGNLGIGSIFPTNRMDVSGAMAIGSSYAGVNTAPTNGLLVQGNVGIGKTNPAFPLDVTGTVQADNLFAGGSNSYSRLYVNGTTGTYNWPLAWLIENAVSNASQTHYAGLFQNNGGAYSGGSAIGVYGTVQNPSVTGGKMMGGSFLTNVDDSQNYGVWGEASGNNNTGSATNYGVYGIAAHGATSIGGYFSASYGTTNYGIQVAGPTAGTNNYAIYSNAAAKSYFAGGMGIGSQLCSGDMLTVNGQVHASSFLTNTTFCDFVFEKDYALMPLDQVEKSINANKHLPGIPSAKEVEDKGLNIGDMEVKMMQKIEELTLYVIDQHKSIERLKKENEELKGRMVSIHQ